jgi:hypothetical protein
VGTGAKAKRFHFNFMSPARFPTRRLEGRGDPDKGDWVDKDDYSDSYPSLVAGEVYSAYNKDWVVGGDHVFEVPLPKPNDFPPPKPGDVLDIEMTTSKTVLFMDSVVSLTVQGLYGCTAVFVISQRGAYAGHIYERKAQMCKISPLITLTRSRNMCFHCSKPFPVKGHRTNQQWAWCQ